MGFWRGEFSKEQICFILEQIKKIRDKNADGRISLKVNGSANNWTSVLVSAIGLDIRTDAIRTMVAKGALFSPELPIDFAESDFRKVAYQQLHRFQDKELRVYCVVFPIWNLPAFLSGNKKFGDVSLNFSPSQKTAKFNKIKSERQKQQWDPDYSTFFTKERLQDLQICSLCFARVKASSPADANERASQALYLILGLINLAKDGGKQWRRTFRSRGRLPVSEVLIGPHTTTHFENGGMCLNGFWHEEWVGGPLIGKIKPDIMAAWERRFLQLLTGVADSFWREKCESAAARYFKAFSNPNLEESFLEGWRLFENISGSRYDKIEEKLLRASNIFEDRVEYAIIGQHLALRRNLLTHGHAIKADDEEELAFQMLQFVVPFVERYILNGFRFKSTDEFWEFLGLPANRQDRNTERAKYEKKLDLLAKAAKFRHEEDW